MILIDGDLRLGIQTALYLVLLLSALRWGGAPERILALVLVWFRVGDMANHALFERADAVLTVAQGHVLIDLVAAAASLGVGLFANRMYALWFAAFQLLALLAHIPRALAPDIAPLAYELMYIGPSYCQIIILAAGLWAHHRRVRRYGPYRAWRSSLLRSPGTGRGSWPSG